MYEWRHTRPVNGMRRVSSHVSPRLSSTNLRWIPSCSLWKYFISNIILLHLKLYIYIFKKVKIRWGKLNYLPSRLLGDCHYRADTLEPMLGRLPLYHEQQRLLRLDCQQFESRWAEYQSVSDLWLPIILLTTLRHVSHFPFSFLLTFSKSHSEASWPW